jgi:hypothetical protein
VNVEIKPTAKIASVERNISPGFLVKNRAIRSRAETRTTRTPPLLAVSTNSIVSDHPIRSSGGGTVGFVGSSGCVGSVGLIGVRGDVGVVGVFGSIGIPGTMGLTEVGGIVVASVPLRRFPFRLFFGFAVLLG